MKKIFIILFSLLIANSAFAAPLKTPLDRLLKNFKKQYKKYNIYVFTQPQYFPYIDDNPYIHKMLPYSNAVENPLMMEGAGDHEGLFDMVFYPHTTTQKNPAYLHNGLDKHQLLLRR